jgi:hypothetical protein
MPQPAAIRGGPAKEPPLFILCVKVFHPSHALSVGDFSTVALGRRPENDLVNGILFDDVPVGGDLRAKQFSQHW